MVQEPGDALTPPLRRVLLIAPEPFYSDRGTPMNVLQMARVLGQAGYLVDLATYPLGRDVAVPGVVIHRALAVPGIRAVPIGFSWKKVVLDLALALTVARLWLTRRHAVVHAVEEAVFLALPLRMLGARLVYDLDSLISHQLAYSGAVSNGRLLAAVHALETAALRRAHAVITVCQALTNAVRALVPAARIFQIEDAPLPETLRAPEPRRVAALRAAHGLGDGPTAIYTGNLEGYQGVELLLAAAPLLRARVPEARVVVVGGEGAALAALRDRLAVPPLQGAVVAVGARPPEEMPEWMALGAALVSPRSEGENTPLKIYTYMRSGVPIVATDRLTHTQVLDATTAVLCEPTPEALADGLARALEDREAAAALGQRARARAERDFGPEAFERKLLEAYRFIEATLG
jgi:glycosyltransferase involved in cell wall biosynthesis